LKNTNKIFEKLISKKGQIALLIDPEKCSTILNLKEILKKAEFSKVDYLFIGGSTVTKNEFDKTIDFIKSHSNLPLVIFPGASHQISEKADAILYLSLLSGRNPDFLIGHHVQTALEVYEMDLEVLPTAYILIDGGTQSSVAYVSQTIPIPRDQISIIKNTATAGVLQGKKIIYFDAGSGAEFSVNPKIIDEVQFLDTPIIVGGGIRSIDQIDKLKAKGVNVIVIGNHIEENIDFLLDIHSYNLTKN
jgi:putative glycerol-1-phosphate prenyltransferase